MSNGLADPDNGEREQGHESGIIAGGARAGAKGFEDARRGLGGLAKGSVRAWSGGDDKGLKGIERGTGLAKGSVCARLAGEKEEGLKEVRRGGRPGAKEIAQSSQQQGESTMVQPPSRLLQQEEARHGAFITPKLEMCRGGSMATGRWIGTKGLNGEKGTSKAGLQGVDVLLCDCG